MTEAETKQAIRLIEAGKKNGYNKEEMRVLGVFAYCSDDDDKWVEYLIGEIEKKTPCAKIITELQKHVRK